jgi:hypothetical protein
MLLDISTAATFSMMNFARPWVDIEALRGAALGLEQPFSIQPRDLSNRHPHELGIGRGRIVSSSVVSARSFRSRTHGRTGTPEAAALEDAGDRQRPLAGMLEKERLVLAPWQVAQALRGRDAELACAMRNPTGGPAGGRSVTPR